MYSNWIKKNIDNNIENKNVVITGSNSGIGLEACFYLASMNANIYMAVRNIERGKIAKDKILEKYPNTKIELLELDLASFDSINKFVEVIKTIDVDVFINNAGVYRIKNQVTKENFELVMGTNYIGTYYLNELLIPYFKTLNHEVKLMFTASLSNAFVKLDYDDFFNNKHPNNLIKTYANSKLAISTYFVFLYKKLSNSNIKVLLFHPGITYTPLVKKAYKSKLFGIIAYGFMRIFFHSSSKAALGIIYALNDNIKAGSYIGPRGLFNFSGYPTINKLTKKAYQNNDKLIEYTNYLLKNL